MLLSFRVANHRSLKDEQQLLLTPSREAEAQVAAPGAVMPVAGLFGANASGKSNVLDAFAWMASMVTRGFQEADPGGGVGRDPFMFDPRMHAEPSSFVVDVMVESVRYTYGFVVDDVQVVEEWLFSVPRRRRLVFRRRGGEYTYGQHSPASLRAVEESTAENVLFLAVAAQAGQDAIRPVADWFTTVRFHAAAGSRHRFPDAAHAGPLLYRPRDLVRLSALLRAADTGIDSVDVAGPPGGTVAPPAAGNLRDQPRSRGTARLVFRHQGAKDGAVLGLSDQPASVRILCDLALQVFDVLETGGVLVADGLGERLHPFVTAPLVTVFQDQDSNPRNAQLLFASHDVTLLDQVQGERVLARDNIWFTEKDDSGVTTLFPLSEFKPRGDDNLKRRYLAGRYGAVPVIGGDQVAVAVAGHGASAAAEPGRQ